MFTAIELATLAAGPRCSDKFSLSCCLTKATLISEMFSLKSKAMRKRPSFVVLLGPELLAETLSSYPKPIRDLVVGIKALRCAKILQRIRLRVTLAAGPCCSTRFSLAWCLTKVTLISEICDLKVQRHRKAKDLHLRCCRSLNYWLRHLQASQNLSKTQFKV